MLGKRVRLLAVLWILTVTLPAAGQDTLGTEEQDSVGMLLTWQQDPATTMIIDWQTEPDDDAESVLRYKKVDDGGDDDNWTEVQADQHEFPYSDRTIHRVELTDLEPFPCLIG